MLRRLFALALAASFALPAAHAEPVPPAQRLVIMLSIDGFPAWLWRDPLLPIPNLRKLAAAGAVADAMVASNPTITWINHTTLVTGVEPRQHGVLFNGLLHLGGPGKPPKVEQWADKAAMVRAFTKGAPIAFRDRVWTKAASYIVEKKQPNLLLFHLLTTDSTNHTYGPGSNASYTAFGYADALVGDLVRSVEKAGLAERTTYLLVTDHGFKKVRQTIDMNVALHQAGLQRVEDKQVVQCDAYAMPQGGLCFIYVTDPAKKAELVPKLQALCQGVEGVEQVILGKDAHSLGMPTPEENTGAGDLILYAKPGYAFLKSEPGSTQVVRESKTYLGTHGYPASDPELEGVFFASGYGIKPSAQPGKITNLQVAPTAARLLGVKLPQAQGQALESILEPSALPVP